VKRRLVAALAAILSAALGAVLLLTYVAGADRRAMAGMQPVQVLVATADVPTGTAGAAMADLVTVKTLPAAALAPGAVQDVTTLAGLVSTGELKPGEQVLASRFADPATLADAGRPVVPRGMQQVSIDLEPKRVLGGDLVPGAHVAVITTIEKRTRLAIRSALVLRVDAAVASGNDAPPAAPKDGQVRVTLAMTAAEATKLVAGADSGAVWFSLVSSAPRTPAAGAVPGKAVTS
jgi:pilus assembly protein CpaB